MNQNIYEFPDRSTVEREAGAWLIRLDSEDPPSAEEFERLREWYHRSSLHREELQNLALFWDKMNVLTELTVPLGKPVAQQERRGFNRTLEKLFGLSSARWAGAVAAVAVVGIVVVVGYGLIRYPLTDTNGLYTTAIGQQLTTTLADGSVIQLNTNTRLEVEYGAESRNISLLQGEAYFTVAKNPERPFRVYAGGGRVQALGTAFSVYLRERDINITVTEGRVALASLKQVPKVATNPQVATGGDRQPNRVKPGQYEESLGTLDAGQGATIKVASLRQKSSGIAFDSGEDSAGARHLGDIVQHIGKQELLRQLSWRNGLLVFAGDPLQQVVDEISRYTTLTIEITDPEVKAIKIGGQFRVGDTEAMFEALQTNFGLHVTRLSDDRVLLAAAK